MESLNYIVSTLNNIKKEDYWSKKPALVSKPSQNWTKEVFGMDAIKWLLVEARIPEECFRIIINGVPQPHQSYSRPIYVGEKIIGNVLDGTKASEALGNGGSLLLTALDEYWKPLRHLCKQLGDKMGTKCSAFGVITPPNQGGFVPHIDRTEQLVFQCEGSKLWDVYGIYKQENTGGEVDLKEIADPIIHENIFPGDILYLPQGSPHAAMTTDTLSCHVTLTFEPVTMGNWIESGLNSIIDEENEYKRSLPPFYFDNEEVYLKLLNEKVQEIKAKLDNKSEEIAKEHMNKYKEFSKSTNL
ncbi:JmjC domain-containing protein [Virgibacillus salexigens]|uniref:JmjC domain-containing protein n=1 Tax=Virgibacillus kapii TaxID=1638645 RepID=A0ABQ2DZP5_9BACI|nr:cupin domain-containing protein [Virgibacillus kapii]GGJ77750.1 hypothetical protein GCM10007111_44140 [Virgibacillus kapii]